MIIGALFYRGIPAPILIVACIVPIVVNSIQSKRVTEPEVVTHRCSRES